MKQALKRVFFLGLALIALGSLSCTQREISPVIQSVIVPKEVPPAFDVTIVCVASNADGKAMTYEWTADNGTMKGEGNAVTWLSPESPGIYTLVVKVSDVNGHAATQQSTVTVTPFKATEFTDIPEIVLQLPVPSVESTVYQVKVTPVTSSGIECSVSSNSTVNYTYTWISNGGKLMGQGIKEGKASRVGWMPPSAIGNYTVTVEVTGDNNNHATGSVYFLVMDRMQEGAVGGGCGCGKK